MTDQPHSKKLGRRLLAWSLDSLVLSLVTTFWSEPATFGTSAADAAQNVVLILVFAGYRIAGHSLWGQTVGKRVLGVRVVGAHGAPVTVGQAVSREALFLLFVGVPLCVFLGVGTGARPMLALAVLNLIVDPAVAVFHPSGRALHDLIARTQVA